MSVDYTFTKTLFDGASNISKSVSISSGQDIRISEAYTGAVTNTLTAFAATIAKIKVFYMVADVACTVKTNSSGSPQETFTLVANQPIHWDNTDGSLIASLFAGNITALYVTTTADTTLTIRCLVDPT